MEIFTSTNDLHACITNRKAIGFVPTMGALHQGHLSLVKKSLAQAEFTICSIFVNPAQFNDLKDLQNYPRTVEKDIQLLQEIGCNAVFIPFPEDIYPQGTVLKKYDFGVLDQTMEGLQRPGHFNGMANVVQRLFEIIKPKFAFFGEKDFQQLLIVKKLVAILQLSVAIIPCEIVREPDGLAMSSRNIFLNQEQRTQASGLYQILRECNENKNYDTPQKLIEYALSRLRSYNLLQVEYFTIVSENDLQHVSTFEEQNDCRMFVAVRVGNIRLIDNMRRHG